MIKLAYNQSVAQTDTCCNVLNVYHKMEAE